MHQVEVIISTYNNPSALDLTLHGLSRQSFQDFSLCIADDGSGPETAAVIERWQSRLATGRLRHVWHPDLGFQKNRILNSAIAGSSADYLIFLDGDCVAGQDFVARHLELRKRGRFCTGGVIRLDDAATAAVSPELIESGTVFTEDWLREHGVIMKSSSRLKSGLLPRWVGNLAEVVSPVKRSWNGGNSSGWRNDILRINGFDESLKYGSEDVELGFRLNNAGIKGRHVRYTCTVLHLEHSRGYADPKARKANRQRALQSLRSGKVRAEDGIVKHV